MFCNLMAAKNTKYIERKIFQVISKNLHDEEYAIN